MMKSDAKLSKTIKILEKIMEMYRISFFLFFQFIKCLKLVKKYMLKTKFMQ